MSSEEMGLRFAEYDDNCVLKYELGTQVFSWIDRGPALEKWLNFNLESQELFTEFMKKPSECLKPLSSKWRVRIADWLVDWGYDKNLSPDLQRAHYELVRNLFHWSLEIHETDDYEVNYKARLYLTILFEVGNRFCSCTSRDREDEVRSVLYEDSQAQILRSFLKEPGQREECLPILKRSAVWFLKRYDLETAQNLFKAINKLPRGNKEAKSTRLRRLVSRISPTSSRFLITRSIALLLILTAFAFPTFGLDRDWMMTGVLSLFYLLIPFMILHYWWHDEPWRLRMLVPRMLSAIIVGYIVVVMTEEMWILAYRMYEDWRLFVVTVLVLSASFIYLYLEIDKLYLEIDKTTVRKHTFRRTMNILVVGLTETLGIGLIMCQLISKYFSPELLETNSSVSAVKLPIMGGEMYPQVLVLFAPVALFIGIFAQILWEDKPISEPL